VDCKSPKDLNSQLYEAKITIKIPSYEVKKGGFFSSDYCMFLVETNVDKDRYRVDRKDADFYTLRKLLRT